MVDDSQPLDDIVTYTPRHMVGKALWNRFVGQHSGSWFWHTWEWQEYCFKYESCVDWSVALMERGEVVGIIPLFLTNSTPSFAKAGGSDCAVPLLAPGKEYLWEVVDHHLARVLGRDQALRVVFRGSPLATSLAPVPAQWGEVGWKTQILDIQQPEEELYKHVRSSYRSLIKQQEREHVFTIISGVALLSPDRAKLPRLLHKESAGRETRPESTWQMMNTWVEEGKAILILAQTPQEKPVGYALAILYKQAAYYASGASMGGGHALQWAMIRALQQRQITHYELGWQEYGETKKEQDIEFFKRGFGGQTLSMPAYLYHSSTKDQTSNREAAGREGQEHA